MPSYKEAYRISQIEAMRARKARVDRLTPDSFEAYYEILVARFIILAALVPFLLGNFVAYLVTGRLNFPVLAIGSAVVFLVMGAVNAANTYFDFEADSGNQDFSVYSGGIRVLVERKITQRKRALWFAVGVMVLALPLGLSLPLYFHTGPWTIPLGLFGALCGWSYTGWPLKLVYRGLGELVVAICGGLLTVVTGYYLQAGSFSPVLIPLAGALGFSILNVILINEFADAASDAKAGKRTFVVRYGKDTAARVYLVNLGLAISLMVLTPLFGIPWWVSLLTLATVVRPAWGNVRRILARTYNDDGINDLTWDTFRVHLYLEGTAMLLIMGTGIVKWL
jgi:1,4-dihydroxy-2-naphthoate octaprenyltransferase